MSQLCPPRYWSHFHSQGLLRGGHWQLHAYPSNQSHGKGTVLYKSSFKFPGRLSMDNSSYMPNHIQVHRPGLGLCSQEPGRSSVLYKYRRQRKVFFNGKQGWRDFPGGPLVKTLRFQCRDLGFDPWLGNGDPTCCTTRPKENKKIGMEENGNGIQIDRSSGCP